MLCVQPLKAWEALWRKHDLWLSIPPLTLSKQILVTHKSFLSQFPYLSFPGLGVMLQVTPMKDYKENTTSHILLLKLGKEGQAEEREIPEGRK